MAQCIYENLSVYSELCSDVQGPEFDSFANVIYSEVFPSAGMILRARRLSPSVGDPVYEELRLSNFYKFRVWLLSLLRKRCK